MSKRIIIWFAVALAGVGVFIGLPRIKKTEMEQDGRVTFQKKSGDLAQFLTRELQQYGGTVTLTGSMPVMRSGRAASVDNSDGLGRSRRRYENQV